MGRQLLSFDDEDLTLVRSGHKDAHIVARRPGPVPAPGDAIRGYEAFRISMQSWRIFQDGVLRVDYRVGGSRRVEVGLVAAKRLVTLASESWIPAWQMGDWASRFALLIRQVTEKRLAEVTEAEAVRGGFRSLLDFAQKWDQTHRTHPVDTNSMIWVVCFEYEPDTNDASFVEYESDGVLDGQG
jgi:hypothetical protein